MKKIKIVLLVSLSFIIFGCNSNEQAEKKLELNSSEYKLLLNPEKFDDYQKAFARYWEIVKTVAAKENIEVLESEHPLKLKHKEISFFDTPELDLRKAGYLLRQKVKYKDGHKEPGFEFGVKFRQIKPEDALAVDLTLAEGYTPKDEKIELESDVVYYSVANEGEETTFSVSNSIIIDKQPAMTVGSFSKIYPALTKLGIPEETILKKVAGISADEWKVAPGKLDFGDGLFGCIDMTIWLLETESGQVKIPEFSFDHPFFKDRKYNNEAMQRCTAFITKLHDAHPEWTVPGTSKTAALFEMN
ncbi:hypothetical protein H8E88_23550 [candidate division KSB1 bacterium]|nr:hypothetical protein [candidate division KSB1 bacterium]MBL7094929.1 hypothetical protein [candidate division KSB1 bacterium]